MIPQPEIVAETWRAAHADDTAVTEAEISETLTQLDPLRDELFRAEQARIGQFLLEHVGICTDELNPPPRVDGLTKFLKELVSAGADRLIRTSSLPQPHSARAAETR